MIMKRLRRTTRLRNLMAQNNLAPHDVAACFDVSEELVRSWIAGTQAISDAKLDLLAGVAAQFGASFFQAIAEARQALREGRSATIFELPTDKTECEAYLAQIESGERPRDISDGSIFELSPDEVAFLKSQLSDSHQTPRQHRPN
jgi:hypothetical protein